MTISLLKGLRLPAAPSHYWSKNQPFAKSVCQFWIKQAGNEDIYFSCHSSIYGQSGSSDQIRIRLCAAQGPSRQITVSSVLWPADDFWWMVNSGLCHMHMTVGLCSSNLSSILFCKLFAYFHAFSLPSLKFRSKDYMVIEALLLFQHTSDSN